MASKRRFSRVSIDFPITCTFFDNKTKMILTSTGKVLDISLGGMRISVPIPEPMIDSFQLEYKLSLPEPFSMITGRGQIKWSDRDDKERVIIFGMAFHHLSPKHKEIIENIVEELHSDK